MIRSLLATIPIWFVSGCGEPPDAPSRFALRGAWEDPESLGWRIAGGPGPVEETALQSALEEAFAAWSALAPVAFEPATENAAPDVLISWEQGDHGSCPPFGRDTSVAHTGPVGPGTYVHLDAERAWTLDNGEGTSLRLTLLHEVGHVLGLDHSPDPAALLHPDPTVDAITASDRDALWTLYGGGDLDSADLVISREGERVATVHGTAPPGRADFTLFDTDGDGDDELVVWRTDAGGNGELVAFHFRRGPRPERTVGPLPGMTDAEAAVGLLVTAEGTRLLVLEYPSGHLVARSFDADGRLQAWSGDVPRSSGSFEERRWDGDLDGDGLRERVGRP